MNNKIYKILTIVLAIVFLGSLAMVLIQGSRFNAAEESYNKAAELLSQKETETAETMETATEEITEAATETVTETVTKEVYIADAVADTFAGIDLAALEEVNPDVIGWIVIPDTRINYPIMQGEDNEYYLKHTWEKESNAAGSIFLECRNMPDFSDFNTLIYGHRMKNESMFGALKYYVEDDYWKEHPYVYIATGESVYRYEVFAAYEASIVSETYQLGFPNDESRQKFIDSALSRSDIDTGIVPGIEDLVLTMSTCTGRGYDTRWVVQARREGEIRSE